MWACIQKTQGAGTAPDLPSGVGSDNGPPKGAIPLSAATGSSEKVMAMGACSNPSRSVSRRERSLQSVVIVYSLNRTGGPHGKHTRPLPCRTGHPLRSHVRASTAAGAEASG